MKLIKKYAGLLLMLTLLVGFTSCEDDEDLEERMFGRVWVGDVGMSAGNGRILYSEFTFDPVLSYCYSDLPNTTESGNGRITLHYEKTDTLHQNRLDQK